MYTSTPQRHGEFRSPPHSQPLSEVSRNLFAGGCVHERLHNLWRRLKAQSCLQSVKNTPVKHNRVKQNKTRYAWYPTSSEDSSLVTAGCWLCFGSQAQGCGKGGRAWPVVGLLGPMIYSDRWFPRNPAATFRKRSPPAAILFCHMLGHVRVFGGKTAISGSWRENQEQEVKVKVIQDTDLIELFS